MPRRYAAFDLETAKVLPQNIGNLLAHRPLGICCAALFVEGESKPRCRHGVTPQGGPAPRMSREESAGLVQELSALAGEGFTIVTWNGLGFDFDVLAEESGLVEECRRLARSHVDMMFHVVCEKGFPVSLQKACEGMELPGKSAGVEQYLAPQFWKDQKFAAVLEYVGMDVAATLQLAVTCETQRKFTWITSKGKPSSMPLSPGWLTVDEALRRPPPDVSWMSDPPSRSKFTRWLEGE